MLTNQPNVISLMYRLSEESIKKIIVACNKYANQSPDQQVRKQYSSIISQLHTYLEQNIRNDNGRTN
jgi:hypothetical protein